MQSLIRFRIPAEFSLTNSVERALVGASNFPQIGNEEFAPCRKASLRKAGNLLRTRYRSVPPIILPGHAANADATLVLQ